MTAGMTSGVTMPNLGKHLARQATRRVSLADATVNG
jgi:hypothetical protein